MTKENKIDLMADITDAILKGKPDYQAQKSLEMGFDKVNNKWIDDDFQQICADFIVEGLIINPKLGRMWGAGLNEILVQELQKEYPKFFNNKSK